MAFESLVVFFLKDILNISAAYPAICFSIGFIGFMTCVVLYAYNYKPNARYKKNPSYILTSAVLFVISVIIVTMVAVYSKAQMSNPAELFAYVLIPVAYLLNIIISALFYYLFSSQERHR
jgi:hypothetical protein